MCKSGQPLCKAVNIRVEKYDVYCGRTRGGSGNITNDEESLGNHHVVGWCKLCEKQHAQGEAVAEFEKWFYSPAGADGRAKAAAKLLPGMKLGCFCAPRKCHCDVLAEYINTLAAKDNE